MTLILGKLANDELIVRTRGGIEVVNRKKIEERACECYKVVIDEYERLLPKK